MGLLSVIYDYSFTILLQKEVYAISLVFLILNKKNVAFNTVSFNLTTTSHATWLRCHIYLKFQDMLINIWEYKNQIDPWICRWACHACCPASDGNFISIFISTDKTVEWHWPFQSKVEFLQIYLLSGGVHHGPCLEDEPAPDSDSKTGQTEQQTNNTTYINNKNN